ncbi:MAG: hypothetical protein R3F60_28905 [bacterium]
MSSHPTLRGVLRLCLALILGLGGAVALPTEADAGVFKKLKKAVSQPARTIEKSSDKSIERARKQLKKAGQEVDAATGLIADAVEEAYDYTDAELNAALRYTEREFEKIAATVEDLAAAAAQALYRRIYEQHLKDYTDLLASLATRLPELTDRIETIALHLARGNFVKAEELARELRDAKVLQPVIEKAHALFGTSLVITVDGDVAGRLPGAGVKPSVNWNNAFGIAINLDAREDQKAVIFGTTGAAAGANLTTDPTNVGGLDIGASIGFSAGKPANVKGAAIDVSGSVGINTWSGTVSMGLPVNARGVGKPNSLLVGVRRGVPFKSQPGLNGDVTVGASYTGVIDRIAKERRCGPGPGPLSSPPAATARRGSAAWRATSRSPGGRGCGPSWMWRRSWAWGRRMCGPTATTRPRSSWGRRRTRPWTAG